MSSSNNEVLRYSVSLLKITGGSCLWSPIRTNFPALLMGINTLGIVACDASSIIAISNLILDKLLIQLKSL